MKNSNLIIEANIELLNEKFTFKDLRWNKQREKISGIFSPYFVGWLSKNVACVQKIFYTNGKNGYHYFAPTGFFEYVELLVRTNSNTVEVVQTEQASI
jgi:hypothetical protein